MSTWRAVPDFPDYEVSSSGEVRSSKPGFEGMILKQFLGTDGYKKVDLYRDQRRFSRYVHALVLLAFEGPRPKGMVSIHKNEKGLDNRRRNLKWGTRKENMERWARMAPITGRRRSSYPLKLTPEQRAQIVEQRRTSPYRGQQIALAKEFGVCTKLIGEIWRTK